MAQCVGLGAGRRGDVRREGGGGPPVVVVCWVTGLDGGAAGRGVRRVVLCGAQGSWGAVGVASVGVPTLVGW